MPLIAALHVTVTRARDDPPSVSEKGSTRRGELASGKPRSTAITVAIFAGEARMPRVSTVIAASLDEIEGRTSISPIVRSVPAAGAIPPKPPSNTELRTGSAPLTLILLACAIDSGTVTV